MFPSILQQVTPTPTDYLTGTFTGSGSGDVTAAITPVDINIADPSVITSGCDGAFTEAAVGQPIVADPAGADDFAGFPAGNVALIQRGGCSFAPQGAQRRGRRRLGRDHLQPGQRPDPGRADRRQRRAAGRQRRHGDHDPGRRRAASPTVSRFRRGRDGRASPFRRTRPAPTSTSSPRMPGKNETTS